jgi:copper homeostasis protein
MPFLKELRSHVGDLQLTFHRAIDESIEWKRSLDELIELKFNRILTSGFSSNVDSGFQILKQMVAYAKDRIEIMPGGGVNINNVKRLLEEAMATSIHFSGTTNVLLDEDSAFSETILRVDEKKVRRMMETIQTLSGESS